MPTILMTAYLGDAVYELYIREYLLKQDCFKMKDIQQHSLMFVSATSQRRIVEKLINDLVLTEEEIELFKTGRNAKGGKSKSTDIITYRYATGFEYLIGTLYQNDKLRLNEIMQKVLGE